jgi:cyclopropane fatty-acyl-phospholipid synthase-like methyltransferase
MDLLEFFATVERYHTIQNPTSEEKLDLAARYCGVRDGMRVLDVGCGKGWLLRRLASRFDISATGLEISPHFAAQARAQAAAEGLGGKIEVVQVNAKDYRAEPASFDLVMCIGASFALGGFESALGWMSRAAKPGAAIAIGEVFARQLPIPQELLSNPATRRDYPDRTLWTTVEIMRAHGLALRGLVEASDDDWDRYHSLHWQAAMDWALENPGHPDAARMTDPAAQRRNLELDRRYQGWAIFVVRNGLV